MLLEAGRADERQQQWVKVTPNYPMAGRLLPAASPSGLFRVGVESDPDDPAAYLLQVANAADVPVGMTHEVITLKSTHPDDPPCTFHASTFLPPPFHVYPGRLRVAPVGRRQLRILFLDQNSLEPIHLQEVRVPGPGVTYEYLRGYSLERARLNVYIEDQQGVEGYIGDVVLVTDARDNPEIHIPVYVDPRVSSAPGLTRWPDVAAGKKGCGCAFR